MASITLEDAQAKLPELIAGLPPGESVAITSNERTVARLVAEPKRGRRRAGSAKGVLTIIEDDDAHLADFQESMQ